VIDYCWRAADVSASAFGPCVIYPKKEGKKEKNQDVQEAKTLAHTLNYMFLIMRHTGKKL